MLSATLKSALFSEETTEVPIVLITIDNPTLTQPIRISSDPTELLPIAGERGTISRGNEFVFLPFDMNMPVQDDTGVVEANIIIDNVDRRIVSAVRSAARERTDILFEIVLASSPDDVEIAHPNMKLDNVTYNALTLEARISIDNLLLEPYPSTEFVPSKWPGLF